MLYYTILYHGRWRLEPARDGAGPVRNGSRRAEASMEKRAAFGLEAGVRVLRSCGVCGSTPMPF